LILWHSTHQQDENHIMLLDTALLTRTQVCICGIVNFLSEVRKERRDVGLYKLKLVGMDRRGKGN